ncbi:MAG: LPP20 family lipoprotein [Prevotella sp.]|nr:LPP20 family lipoprotein [Prevotella sp.]MBR1546481.1 LPP20 family lipoprotein [Prevotella sp.]
MRKNRQYLVGRLIALWSLLLLSTTVSAQSWEIVRDSEDYIYGEGYGKTVAEAERNALANLIGKIATNVTGEAQTSLKTQSSNGKLDEESQFTQTVSTYSQATLTNTQQQVLQTEPDAYVVRWIKKSEVEKIFESRKRKAIDLVESAIRAERKGKVDDVLRNYYWALTLLKSLQYPNEVTYTDEDGKEHVLTNWCKEKIDDTFDELKAIYDSRDGNDIRLSITYKGKPVNSVDYKYWDGQTWSAIYSAKDGWGVLELAPGYEGSQVQLRYEFEYAGEAKIDKEVEMVLNAVKGTPMPDAYTNVILENKEKPKETAARHQQMASQSFTTNSAEAIAPPKTLTKKDKDASKYMTTLEQVVKAIKEKRYDSVRPLFSDGGWDMFTKLMKYGKGRVLDSSDIRLYDDKGSVLVRGLRMSFSFASGVRKSFVEDVVFAFNEEQKIDNIAFGLGKTAEDDILYKGVWEEKSRFAIMNFLENYKTAYALKRLDYIRSIFDDDAVIITGSVVSRANKNVNIENQSTISQEGNLIIRKNRQTKDQYLENLKRCFARNEFVNIRFSNNDVIKMGEGGESYAIQIQQDYYSSTYGDKGYLMLMVDINQPDRPLIKLRTWQPEKDPEFGLYGPGDF